MSRPGLRDGGYGGYTRAMNFNGYDAWLEKPYAEAALDAEFAERAIEAYAEHFGWDEDDVNEDTAVDWFLDYEEDRRISAHEDDLYERARERDLDEYPY
jgi:hypothetical protein